MKLFTIGFTKKSAEIFFTKLKEAGIGRLVDVRLNNVSQLATFAKRDDLKYFTNTICGIDYHHIPALAPNCENPRPLQKAETWRLAPLRAPISRSHARSPY